MCIRNVQIFKMCRKENKHWSWIMVEPVPTNLKVLKRNVEGMKRLHSDKFQQGSVIVEGCAISVTNTTEHSNKTFYSLSSTVDPKTGYDSKTGVVIPTWLTQVGSFQRGHLAHHLSGPLADLNANRNVSLVCMRRTAVAAQIQPLLTTLQGCGGTPPLPY